MQKALKYIVAGAISFFIYLVIRGFGTIENMADGGIKPGYQIAAVFVGVGLFIWLVAKIKD